MLWLYDLPAWQLALLSVLTFTSIAWLCLWLIRPPLQRSAVAQLIDNSTVGYFFSGVSLLYGLLLGLLTVATWGNFTTASGIASKEAAQLAVLYRDLSGYAPAEGRALRVQLKAYTTHIIQQSWPTQRRGRINDAESEEFLKLQTQLLAYMPITIPQQLIHQQGLQVFNVLAEQRRMRAESIGGGVPAVIWWVVLLGAVLTLVFAALFSVPTLWFHGLLSSLLGITLGLLIFLITALDHPYLGEVSVGPDAYKLVLDKVMRLP